jgi:starvation-inducible DNA-binding protein
MAKHDSSKQNDLKRRRASPLVTPTDLGAKASKDIAGSMNGILADVFALYMKTKNFHWHMSGPHFRDYHLLFDEQADQLYAMTDPIAERIRKTGRLRRSPRYARRAAGGQSDVGRASARGTRSGG